jgi:hypothetical protein
MECVYSVYTVNIIVKYDIAASYQGLITKGVLKRKIRCLFCGMNGMCLQCVHCKLNYKIRYRRQLAGVDYESVLRRKIRCLFCVMNGIHLQCVQYTVNKIMKFDKSTSCQGLIMIYVPKIKMSCLFCGMNGVHFQCVHCK